MCSVLFEEREKWPSVVYGGYLELERDEKGIETGRCYTYKIYC
jgi:hypothetical protein